MPNVQMDALSSFVYLTENVPTWLTQVEELSAHTTKKHSEFAAEYTRLLKHARPKKTKSPSLVSNRSTEKVSEHEKTTPKSHISSSYPAPGTHLELNPLDAGNKYLFANARRQKKTTGGASMRSGASGSLKFRQRHAVVIYYDSYVQESFESMVKNIGIARNNLRKGKKARSLARGPMFPSFNPSANGFSFQTDKLSQNLMMAQVNINPKNNFSLPTPPNSASDDSFFDLADKNLEQAQSFCETAAHQFLRDGDSTLELRATKEKLEMVAELAKATVERLREEERVQKQLEEAEAAADKNENEKQVDPLPIVDINPLAVPKTNTLAAIEVDSDGDGDDDLDLSQFRAMIRPRALRS
ncbi:hypothetical protein UCRPC4_g01335 [Phaeomoniella chlamydospora]|uniref:Uncharacterized protein n=1 Tax=Phaeomoniella chlamydospora TaxID=158046 RepID=A0A0G2GUQ3_PHACM|nr:hypothetical protein UCRPC4_g01335 [Phaeomoniella chlamydospora]